MTQQISQEVQPPLPALFKTETEKYPNHTPKTTLENQNPNKTNSQPPKMSIPPQLREYS